MTDEMLARLENVLGRAREALLMHPYGYTSGEREDIEKALEDVREARKAVTGRA